MNKDKAGFVARGGALVIDILVLIIPIMLLSVIPGINVIVVWVYFILMTLKMNGQTLGKKVFGVQVVSANGSPLGTGQVILRETVGKLLSGFVFDLGYLWVIWDPQKQGWHDKIAGTYVLQITPLTAGKKLLAWVLMIVIPIVFGVGLVAVVSMFVFSNYSKQLKNMPNYQSQQNYTMPSDGTTSAAPVNTY